MSSINLSVPSDQRKSWRQCCPHCSAQDSADELGFHEAPRFAMCRFVEPQGLAPTCFYGFSDSIVPTTAVASVQPLAIWVASSAQEGLVCTTKRRIVWHCGRPTIRHLSGPQGRPTSTKALL